MKTFLLALSIVSALWAQNPTVGAITPNGGTALSQTFSLSVSDPAGGGNITEAVMLITPYNDYSGAHACFVVYFPVNNTAGLFNDTATTLAGTVTGGQSGSANNSQCTLSGAGIAKTISGNQMTVTLPITFNSAWTDLKYLYGYGQNSANLNSGYIQRGSWNISGTPQTPAIASLTPNFGTGFSQTFTLTVADPTSGSNIDQVNLMIGSDISLPGFGSHACSVIYFPLWNAVTLYTDAGTNIISPALTPGQTGTVSNAQCTLDGKGVTQKIDGAKLIVTIPVTFKAAWPGPEYIYEFAHNLANLTSGWIQEQNLWTVPNSVVLSVGDLTIPAAPATSGTFTYRIESNAQASNMGLAYLRIGTTNQFTTANVCDISYDPVNDWLYLTNDAGTGSVAYGHPGQAPTYGTFQNAQCSLSLASTVVNKSGAELSVSVPITFTPAFYGTHTLWVFGNPGNLAANPTGWQNKGTYTIGVIADGSYASIGSVGVQPGVPLMDDYSGMLVTSPTSVTPFVAVRLRDGKTVQVQRADNIKVSRMDYSNEPAGDGVFAYHFTIDSRQLYMIRLGEVQDNGFADGATQASPKGWGKMGVGWVEYGDVERAADSVFSINSKWRPGLMPIYLAGEGMKAPTPYSPKTDDNERVAAVASVFNNSVQRFVIGPAIPPDATQDTLNATVQRWVEDYGFGFLRPVMEGQGFDAVTPTSDLERDALKYLKEATAALSRK